MHIREVMRFKMAGALNFLGVIHFLGVWVILLFVAQPDTMSTYEAARDMLASAITKDGAGYFYLTILSMVTCATCGVLLFSNKYPLQAMYVIATHTLLGLWLYDWSLALIIGLPLLCFNQVRSNA